MLILSYTPSNGIRCGNHCTDIDGRNSKDAIGARHSTSRQEGRSSRVSCFSSGARLCQLPKWSWLSATCVCRYVCVCMFGSAVHLGLRCCQTPVWSRLCQTTCLTSRLLSRSPSLCYKSDPLCSCPHPYERMKNKGVQDIRQRQRRRQRRKHTQTETDTEKKTETESERDNFILEQNRATQKETKEQRQRHRGTDRACVCMHGHVHVYVVAPTGWP